MAFNKESFEHFWQHLDVLFGKKVDKVAGKGLSSNDFTNEDKEKLASLKESAQSDWNVNDENDPAYVKNRTHYAIGNILYDVEIYITQQEGTRAYDFIDGLIPFESDKVYTIIWDGVNYECTSWGDNNIVIGNYAIVGNPDNFENSIQSDAPFVILVSENTFLQIFGDNGKHTLKIIDGVEEVKQLDEKYIPDTIARVEDIKTLSSDPRENSEENPELSAVPINADTLGGKLPSEYLDVNATAIDSYKLGGLAPEYYTWTDNLLFNSNFQKPYLINLNGASGSYEAWSGEKINKWWVYANGVTFENFSKDGVTYTGGIFQLIDEKKATELAGQTFTLGAKINGTVYAVSGIVTLTNEWHIIGSQNTATGNIRFEAQNDNKIFVVIDCSTSSLVEWAVLVPGTYTAETLPQPQWLHPRLEMIRMGLSVQPRNLLDNSDFRNPVNQRGQTSYTGTGYGIDRWRTNYSGDTVKIASGGVKNEVNSSSDGWHLHQIIEVGEELVGKAVTVAAKVVAASTTDCRIICSFRNSSNSEISFIGVKCVNGVISASGVIPVGTVQIRVGLFAYDMTSGDYVTLEWAALYEGAYTAETLPPYRPKGYAVELDECLRYFERLKAYQAYQSFGTGLIQTSTLAIVPVYYTRKRIVVPTVTHGGSLRIKGTDNYEASAISFGQIGAGSCLASVTITGATAGQCGVLQANGDNTAYIDISADL